MIEFVVPDGFHGIFIIQEDPIDGTPPFQEGGFFRYTIPETGELRTTNAAPCFDWHSSSARYASGQKVPDQSQASADQHTLIGLSTDDRGRMKWLIGTKADFDKYWENRKIWHAVESQ